MVNKKQFKGKCFYCEGEIIKNEAAKHLAGCVRRQEAISKAGNQKGQSETLYHLRIQAIGLEEFWLDLEMRSSAILKNLDDYLKAIWLECCGHLSQFLTAGRRGDKISFGRRAGEVFGEGVALTHIYDFGTSSETMVTVIEARQGKPTTSRPIFLMARNVMPECKCIECERPAGWLCLDCLNEQEVWGSLCDEHAKTHPHNNYGEPVKLVNSPRLGLCGYDGPAESPY